MAASAARRQPTGTTIARSAWRPTDRARFVVDTLGGPAAAARVLDVHRSQTSRWASGQAAPGPEQARLLVDLDHVLASAALVWDPEVIGDWLQTANAHLAGARPIDVLRISGSSEVTDALRAEAAGAFA